MAKTDYRIGISGWRYPPWRGSFYPKGLVQKRELAFASRELNSIEINGSFYSLQTPDSYRKWRKETPPGFVFAVKASRYITHIRRLRDPEPLLANFFASGVLALEEKLGAFLWQLPPSFAYERGRIEAFLRALPRTYAEAARLARRHEAWMQGRTFLRPRSRGRLRHALEVRHESFAGNPEFLALLRKYGVAIVIADTAKKWPYLPEVTADFLYLRLHGDRKLYFSGYTPHAIAIWEKRIRGWVRAGEGRGALATKRGISPVFVYFDNTAKEFAPRDAKALRARLGTGKSFERGSKLKTETRRLKRGAKSAPKSKERIGKIALPSTHARVPQSRWDSVLRTGSIPQ